MKAPIFGEYSRMPKNALTLGGWLEKSPLLERQYKNQFDSVLVNEILMKKKALVLNREIINFSFKSNTLNNYSLSQFSNNKYILLCFWASWCAPCKKNIPLLKDISKRYSEKGLQIISISIDDDKKKWLTALKNFEMPGIQTCDIKEFINEKETIRNRYYIHAIPQYFLIDKKGIIIYHNLQMKDTDYTSLV